MKRYGDRRKNCTRWEAYWRVKKKEDVRHVGCGEKTDDRQKVSGSEETEED